MKIKIIFVLLPHTNLLDLGGASQVFHEAKDHGLACDIEFCSYSKNLTSSAGLTIGTVKHYSEVTASPDDYIFIMSADYKFVFSSAFKVEKSFLAWLENNFNAGVNMCAICNGVFLLAMTGLLDFRSCTTHWNRTGDLQKRLPHARVLENILYVEDDRIITSAGASSGIDVALHILSKIRGDYFTYKVSRDLVVYNRRNGNDIQRSVHLEYRNHVHLGIHRTQDWLNENLHTKCNLEELAEMAHMSLRNFTRVFKKETSLTVNEYILELRLARIRELMNKPDITRYDLAKACGLKSERQVSRLISLLSHTSAVA